MDHGIETKLPTLKKIMRKDMKLRYKRIEATSWKGNAPKNIILR